MRPSLAARQQAAALVDAARTNTVTVHTSTRDLVNQAIAAPAHSVDVLRAVIELAAAPSKPPELPSDPDSYVRYLKHAHAKYAGGDRAEWVCQGEREYQRWKKRRARGLTGPAAIGPRTPDAPTGPECYQRFLRAAHTAHARGARAESVCQGEREYQRHKKQRQKQQRAHRVANHSEGAIDHAS